MNVTLFCDKVKAPACAVTFLCGRNASPEDPATWDMSVPPGKMFRYRWHDAPGSFAAAIKDAGWSEKQTRMGPTVCVVRSNDPVEVYSLRNMLTGSFSFLPVSQRISPPEPYPCLSSNAALSSLTVSGGGTLSPSFDSDTTVYTFTTRATKVTLYPDGRGQRSHHHRQQRGCGERHRQRRFCSTVAQTADHRDRGGRHHHPYLLRHYRSLVRTSVPSGSAPMPSHKEGEALGTLEGVRETGTLASSDAFSGKESDIAEGQREGGRSRGRTARSDPIRT